MPGKGKPFVKGDARAGRPKGRPNVKTKELKEFLSEVRQSSAYQDSLKRRLEAGRAPHVETLVVRDELGDPTQKHRIDGELVVKIQPVQVYIPDNRREATTVIDVPKAAPALTKATDDQDH